VESWNLQNGVWLVCALQCKQHAASVHTLCIHHSATVRIIRILYRTIKYV
jgi:hypothetical protein